MLQYINHEIYILFKLFGPFFGRSLYPPDNFARYVQGFHTVYNVFCVFLSSSVDLYSHTFLALPIALHRIDR